MSPPDSTCRLWLGSLVPGHVLLCPVPNGWAEDGACNEDAHVPGDVAGGSGEEVSEIGQDCCLHGLNPPSALFSDNRPFFLPTCVSLGTGPSGGIGIHGGLKIRRPLKACGFESHLGHSMDEKKNHATEKAQEENRSTAEVIDFGDGSLAVIIPEEIVRRLGWREGEEVKVDCKEGKISVTRTDRTAW